MNSRENFGAGDKDLTIADLFKICWDLRKYAAGGFFIGLALAGIAWAGFVVPWYTSKISVNIDPSSLPAVTDTKAVIQLYSSMLSSPEYAYGIFESINGASSSFAGNLKKTNFSLNSITNLQVTTEDSEKLPLKVLPTLSTNDFFVAVRLPAKGLGGQAANIIVSAFNEQIRRHNTRIERDHAAAASSVIADSRQRYLAVANKLQSEGQELYEKKFKLRERSAAVEYRLFRKLLQGGASTMKFAEIAEKSGGEQNEQLSSVCIQNFEGKMCPPKLAKSDREFEQSLTRTLRMLAALTEEKKISEAESRWASDELISIQTEQSRIHGELSRFNRPVESSLQSLLAATEQESTNIDRARFFLPTFVVNNQVVDGGALGRGLEKPISRSFLLVILSGGLLGALFLSAAAYIRQQFQR